MIERHRRPPDPITGISLEVTGLVKAYEGAGEGVFAVNGVGFTVEDGKFYTLLGPSGCGKSTTLRCVAGLESVDKGTIKIDGRVVSDRDARVFVPPDDRNIGMVFQSYAIWPHMTVFDNVAFPLQASKQRDRSLGKTQIRQRVMETLEKVQLEGFEKRMSTRLSGGQQQRLALARALVNDPKLLLLDEPLSNLDAALREEMRTELRALQRRTGVTTIYVTHDQAEALSMSNVVAVMENGRIVQSGRPREIYRWPATKFVASFVGRTNLFDARIVGKGSADSMILESFAGRIMAVCPEGVTAAERVAVSIRPEDIRIHTQKPPEGLPNVVVARVERGMYVGDAIEYQLYVGDQLVISKQHPDVYARRHESVWLELPPDHLIVLSDDHGTTRRLQADHDAVDRPSVDDSTGDEENVLVEPGAARTNPGDHSERDVMGE